MFGISSHSTDHWFGQNHNPEIEFGDLSQSSWGMEVHWVSGEWRLSMGLWWYLYCLYQWKTCFNHGVSGFPKPWSIIFNKRWTTCVCDSKCVCVDGIRTCLSFIKPLNSLGVIRVINLIWEMWNVFKWVSFLFQFSSPHSFCVRARQGEWGLPLP